MAKFLVIFNEIKWNWNIHLFVYWFTFIVGKPSRTQTEENTKKNTHAPVFWPGKSQPTFFHPPIQTSKPFHLPLIDNHAYYHYFSQTFKSHNKSLLPVALCSQNSLSPIFGQDRKARHPKLWLLWRWLYAQNLPHIWILLATEYRGFVRWTGAGRVRIVENGGFICQTKDYFDV
jgi:hypothetical protein